MVSVMFMLFFFFFQAEDGIRDLTVTGVQTCALPIYKAQTVKGGLGTGGRLNVDGGVNPNAPAAKAAPAGGGMSVRSEEHTSELQSQSNLVCRLLLEKKKNVITAPHHAYEHLTFTF